MKKVSLSLSFIALSLTLLSQTILVQPYLQDAEPTSVKIMWETDGGTTHTVNWGTTSGNLNNVTPATSIVSDGANRIHEAWITGLSADTRYYYSASSNSTNSAIFDFITPPLKSSNASFNIIAVSDMQKDGSHPNVFDEVVHQGIIDYLAKEFGNDVPTDLGFVLIPGDLVVNGNNYNQWKNDFFDEAHPLFAHVPVYPVLGNHENNAALYFRYFELPDNGTAGFEEHWWYKDYSNIRIIGLDSNSGYRIQAQLDWLQATLNDACIDDDIDFVFAQLHHPHLSELWTPGETDYTGDVISLMESFTTDCGKPSLHFFGHTHGYSRGQSRDHEHLWVNVATSGGAIDNWGEFPNADYAEFNKSIDEYGFVIVNVEAGATPQFTLKRISRGDETTSKDNVEQDAITLTKASSILSTPLAVFPVGSVVNPDCTILEASQFSGGNLHQASHWQVSTSCADFSSPVIDSWKQHENWYDEVDTQAGDLLSDEEIGGLNVNSNYCWRVRYRDEHLKWSSWSTPVSFTTGESNLSVNMLTNGDGEDGVNQWTIETGIIESLGAGECGGVNPFTGSQYLAVGGLCNGNETSFSEVYQVIDISSMTMSIDNGTMEILFGGYLSNFGGSDRPSMFMEYLDIGGSVISTSAVLTTLSSSWTLVQTTETVPVNTRSLKVTLTGTRNAGTDNDSYFDDLVVQIPGEDCSKSTALPIELLSFNGTCKDNNPTLTWEVASELNVRAYQIEGSHNGLAWEMAGSEYPIKSAGSNYKQYSHTVQQYKSKMDYFRLKIIDQDGSFDYSPIINLNCLHERQVSVFPNPSTYGPIKLNFEQNKYDELNISVFNLLGHMVYERDWNVGRGHHELSIPTDNWSLGIYLIKIQSPTWQWEDILIRN